MDEFAVASIDKLEGLDITLIKRPNRLVREQVGSSPCYESLHSPPVA